MLHVRANAFKILRKEIKVSTTAWQKHHYVFFCSSQTSVNKLRPIQIINDYKDRG